MRCGELERAAEGERAAAQEVQRLREAALKQLRAAQAEAHEMQQRRAEDRRAPSLPPDRFCVCAFHRSHSLHVACRLAATEDDAAKGAAAYMQGRAEQAACIARLEEELRRAREGPRPRSPYGALPPCDAMTGGVDQEQRSLCLRFFLSLCESIG